MTTYTIKEKEYGQVTVKLPASKSISNRALIIRALTGNQAELENISNCDDTEVVLAALKDMPETIDIKAAGTAMRFMTAYLCATENGEHTITGTERMRHRPISVLVNALRHLGADISYAGEEGFPPLRIRGKRLRGGRIEMAGGVSSQFVSALLLTGPVMQEGLELHLTGEITSRPYIDLTLWMMREFGAEAEWTSVDTINVAPRPYSRTSPYYIESDWSAASYWYELMALSRQADAEVRMEGLMDGSKQGDSAVRYIFSLLGVRTIFKSRTAGKPTTVTLKKNGRQVTKMEYDFTGQPDLAQTLVVTCAVMGVPFHFKGLKTLKIKETDRIEALKRELRKLGIVLHDVDGQELYWDGERCEAETGSAIDTYEDHRMALAFAPTYTRQAVNINNPEVVSKSYPHFWEELEKVADVRRWTSDGGR